VALVDAVTVAYNSRAELRGCVEPLVAAPEINVIVVDNDSPDADVETIADLSLTVIREETNSGFGRGCNRGWRTGGAPFVLFVNPDARIDVDSVTRLVSSLADDSRVGAAVPRILSEDGSLEFSLRRFPRLRSTFAQALFLHRLFPTAGWVDEVIRDPSSYEHVTEAEWASGACMLVRRSLLEQIDGFDEGFFLYCEDKDICKRLWNAGYSVRFQPAAVCRHIGGASGDRSALLPVLAASRLRYARKHRSRPAAAIERIGIALSSLTHTIVSRSGAPRRRGHLRALLVTTVPGFVSFRNGSRTHT
jgi:hypothetical protein